MTDDHLDDEQLTALQDGEGRPEAGAHLAGCDRCRRRAAALTDVAGLVGASPPAPPAAERRAAVAAALAEAHRPVAPPHRPRRRTPEWLLPVAAVVVLLALVAAIVPRLGNGSDDDSGAGGEALSQGAESAQGDPGAAGGGRDDQPAARGAAPPAADLGAVDDEAELARRVQVALAGQPAADEASGTAAPCPLPFEPGGRDLGPVRLRSDLLWRGQPAEVLSDGERAVVIVAGGCSVLADVPLG